MLSVKKPLWAECQSVSSNLHVSAIDGFYVKWGRFVTAVQAAAERCQSECLGMTSVSPAPRHVALGRRAACHLDRCDPMAGRASPPPGGKALGDQHLTSGGKTALAKLRPEGQGTPRALHGAAAAHQFACRHANPNQGSQATAGAALARASLTSSGWKATSDLCSHVRLRLRPSQRRRPSAPAASAWAMQSSPCWISLSQV